MSNFEDFFSEYEDKHNCSPEKYECFEAGAQSKQAEVDELQHKVKCEREISLFADKLCVDLQSQVDELRKRIDEALYCLRKDVELYGMSDDVEIAINHLKGTTNEQ